MDFSFWNLFPLHISSQLVGDRNSDLTVMLLSGQLSLIRMPSWFSRPPTTYQWANRFIIIDRCSVLVRSNSCSKHDRSNLLGDMYGLTRTANEPQSSLITLEPGENFD